MSFVKRFNIYIDKLHYKVFDIIVSNYIIVDMSENVEVKSRKNILLGSIIGYATIFLNIIFGLFSIPLIISMVGESGYGLFTLSTSIINSFVIDFGLGTVANHHLSKALAEKNDEHFKTTLTLIYRIYLILDIIFFVIIGVLVLFSNQIFVGLTPQEQESFKIVLSMTGLFSIVALPSTIFNSVLSAHENFFFIKVVNLLSRILYIGVTLAVLFLGGGLYGLVLSHIGTSIFAILAKYIYMKVKYKTKIDLKRKISKIEVKTILAFSIWACVQTLCNRFSATFLSPILGITSDSTQIAIFGVIYTFENYISMIANVMSGFFLPKLNRINTSTNKEERLKNIATFVGKAQAFLILLIIIGFVSCGREFISVWITGTDSFDSVYLGTIFIIVVDLFYIPQYVLYTAMFTEKSRMKHLAYTAIAKTIICYTIVFPLTIYYGAIGGALTIAISKIIEILFQNYFYKKDLHINLLSYYKETYSRFILPSIAALMFGLIIKFGGGSNWTKIIKTIIIVTTVFGVFSYVSLKKEDRDHYLSILKIRRRKH